jgi:hypothetical protein
MPPRSKISQLPAHVREWLHSAFVDRAFGGIEGITAELQAKLREAGVAVYIGKSAVGAESQKVQRAQEALRATTEAARLIAKTASQEGDPLGGATMALVQSEIFELVLKTREAADEVEPGAKIKLLNQVALAASRLSRATVNQDKWRSEVDASARAAADKVTKLAQKGGLQPKTVEEIRRSILGIASAEAVAQAKRSA